jgi:hypothetical protein
MLFSVQKASTSNDSQEIHRLYGGFRPDTFALGAHSETEKVTGGRRWSSEAARVKIMGQNALVQRWRCQI